MGPINDGEWLGQHQSSVWGLIALVGPKTVRAHRQGRKIDKVENWQGGKMKLSADHLSGFSFLYSVSSSICGLFPR